MDPEVNALLSLEHCGEVKPVGTLVFVWPTADGLLVLSCHGCTERMLVGVSGSVDPRHAQPFPTYVVAVTVEVRCGGRVSQVVPEDN